MHTCDQTGMGSFEYTAFWNSRENVLTLFECFKDSEAAERHL